MSRGPRFRVTELEGWAIQQQATRQSGGSTPPGLSVQVVDTWACYRVIESWRTEGGGGSMRSHDQQRAHIRAEAAEVARLLNAGLPAAPRDRMISALLKWRREHNGKFPRIKDWHGARDWPGVNAVYALFGSWPAALAAAEEAEKAAA